MTRFLLIFVLVIYGCVVHTQRQPGDIVMTYPFAKDSFLIRVNDLSAHAQLSDTIHFIYYPDASLKSGKDTEAMIAAHKNELLKRNYVFVGIAHFGAFRPRRRRDFIPPSVKTERGYVGVNAGYGQADTFYNFLRNNIMPLAEKKFSGHIIERSFIGHSLSGLFAVYLFVNNDSLFSNLYVLSPALWIDDYHILEYEKLQQDKLNKLTKNIWISCGGNETVNRILNGVERIEDTLDKRKYPGIQYRVKVYPGENHNSSVSPALHDVFTEWEKN